MPRFYISDGARPGRRTPALDYGQKGGAGSDILNEAQAIARGRKLVATASSLAPVLQFAPKAMTSNTAPSPFVVTRSQVEAAAYEAWRMFDGSPTGTQWSPYPSTFSPCWAGVDLGAGNTRTLHHYGIVAVSGQAPASWTIQGSNDGTNWNVVDTQTGITTSWGVAERQFTPSAESSAYRHFRLAISAPVATYIGIRELYLYGRAAAPAPVVGYNRFRFTFAGGPRAQFGFIGSNGGIAAFAAPGAVGTNLFNSMFVSAAAGPNWSNFSPSLFQSSHASLSPYSYTPTWLSVVLSAPIQPGSFRFVEYTGEAGAWRFTPGAVLIEGSNDGVSWTTVKNVTPAAFTAGIGAVTGNGTAYTINV